MLAQDIWDWATSFWCDKGAAWILPQKADVRLGISNPGAVEWIGLPFTAATRDEAHSHRGLVYGRVLDAAKTLMSNGGDSVKVSPLFPYCRFRVPVWRDGRASICHVRRFRPLFLHGRSGVT